MCNTFLTNAFVHFSTTDCNICEPFKNCSTCSYSIVHPSFSLGFHLVKVEPHTRCLFSVKSQQSALIGNLTVHKKFLARQSSPIDALRRFCLPRQPSSTTNHSPLRLCWQSQSQSQSSCWPKYHALWSWRLAARAFAKLLPHWRWGGVGPKGVLGVRGAAQWWKVPWKQQGSCQHGLHLLPFRHHKHTRTHIKKLSACVSFHFWARCLEPRGTRPDGEEVLWDFSNVLRLRITLISHH